MSFGLDLRELVISTARFVCIALSGSALNGVIEQRFFLAI
jgi:hypothetical protein